MCHCFTCIVISLPFGALDEVYYVVESTAEGAGGLWVAFLMRIVKAACFE